MPSPSEHLLDIPVLIRFKAAIAYRGKFMAAKETTAIKIHAMDRDGMLLDDQTWVPMANVVSISPYSEARRLAIEESIRAED